MAVARCKDNDVKFCSHELIDLDPGHTYRFRCVGINEQMNDVRFQATCSGLLLNVSKVASGKIKIGQTISGEGVVEGSTVKNMATVLSGRGGTGTYSLSSVQEKPIERGVIMRGKFKNKIVVEFIATLRGATLTVSEMTYGQISTGLVVLADGIGYGTKVESMGNDLTGNGGPGTYELIGVPQEIDKKTTMRGYNVEDLVVRVGPPSEGSYTASTNPGEPEIPNPPFIAKLVTTLINIFFFLFFLSFYNDIFNFLKINSFITSLLFHHIMID